jgi:hypothetical protein
VRLAKGAQMKMFHRFKPGEATLLRHTWVTKLVISAFYSLDAHDVRVDAIEENLTASPRIIVPAHQCADDEMGSSRSGLMMCCEDVGGMACLSH